MSSTIYNAKDRYGYSSAAIRRALNRKYPDGYRICENEFGDDVIDLHGPAREYSVYSVDEYDRVTWTFHYLSSSSYGWIRWGTVEDFCLYLDYLDPETRDIFIKR